ncbi:MAG: glutamate 5-kinase [Candidatus Omnitrophota bacterium]|nr:glutamate 5-kinase [Candidatus Omnitrophota bacterium]
MKQKTRKELLRDVRRVVVKVGTSILTTNTNRLDTSYIEELTEEIAALRRDNRQVALVTSGAIAAGMKILGLNRRPDDLPALQAAAAVGQSNLMRTYERLFREQGFTVGQILLTADIALEPERFQNARNTLRSLFSFGVIPIINENDAVAVEEIRFGDNDTLSALVAKLVDADLLIILSDVDGFLSKGKVVPKISAISPSLMAEARGSKSEKTRGGMTTKLEAARMVTREGKPVIIANGRHKRVLTRILAGEETGTIFLPVVKPQKANLRLTKVRTKE